MRVSNIITTMSPVLGVCKRCGSDMASVYEVPGEKLKVKCLSCGTLNGDHPRAQIFFTCPSCTENKLNLGTCTCEACSKKQPIDFLKEAKVSYNDREKKYSQGGKIV